MGLFQPIPINFRPILGSLDLDLGHLGPISGVWAMIFAIKGPFLPISRGLDLDLGHSASISEFRAYLRESGHGFGSFRANFLES